MAHFSLYDQHGVKSGGDRLQSTIEITIFMQKAIYYCSKLIAARGIIELTDRMLNFEVSSLDASFGIKNISIDLGDVTDVKILCGDLNPKIVLYANARKYEFVLSGGQELYDRLKDVLSMSGERPLCVDKSCFTHKCRCGREINNNYHFCPWCGAKI
ncbi:MAG: hypothetical protein JW746_02265 [Candidatus Krumholzibacteriota bacterium]|nr:hypothetical protein [Candidatus Krumholzibacteriota bacterium]